MMLPTHAFAGLVLALPFALAIPEVGNVALIAGLVGGIFPDLDMYLGHRKSLHFPVYATVLALVVTPVAVVVPTVVTVVAACFLLATAVHSVGDVFGGGLELRPWEATSERAVYNHYSDRWIAPRRVIRYDGAPEDLVLAVALGAPLLSVLDGFLDGVVLGGLIVAVTYAGTRRVLPAIAEALAVRLHAVAIAGTLVQWIPSRYLDGLAINGVSAPRSNR